MDASKHVTPMCIITAALYMCVCHSIHDVFTCSYPLPYLSMYIYKVQFIHVYHA